MILQISSGKGPVECRAAVGGIYKALKKEFSDIETVTTVKGEAEGTFFSIIFSSEQDLSGLEGTMQWICKSKYRPGHKRKNWFVDVSTIPEPEEISCTRQSCASIWGENFELMWSLGDGGSGPFSLSECR